MLYLLQQPSDDSFSEIYLKVGYADNLDTRLKNYIYHCPTTKVLCNREGGRKEEYLLHSYLHSSKFHDKCRYVKDEWYIIPRSESRGFIKVFLNTPWDDMKKVIWEERLNLLSRTSILGYEVWKEMYEALGSPVISHLSPTYSVDISFYKKVYNGYSPLDIFLEPGTDELSEIVELTNNIRQASRFDYKFKLYCEFREKFKDNHDVTERLLVHYQGTELEGLYSHFGIDRCRAVGYQALDLKRDFLDELNSDSLRKEVLKNFELGKRYTLKDIKISLKDIYRRVGILNKNAKASDLKDYFKVKICWVYNSATKKQSKAYLLISILF